MARELVIFARADDVCPLNEQQQVEVVQGHLRDMGVDTSRACLIVCRKGETGVSARKLVIHGMERNRVEMVALTEIARFSPDANEQHALIHMASDYHCRVIECAPTATNGS